MTRTRNYRGVVANVLKVNIAVLLAFTMACGASESNAAWSPPESDSGNDSASTASRMPGSTDAGSTPAVCGDGVCEPGESCTTCANDCGQCPTCTLAPSCSQGLALPSQPQSVAFAGLATRAPVATDDAGVTLANTCQDAQLRLRISRIDVGHQAKQVWLPTGTISGPPQSYYCLLQASDGAVVSGSGPDAGTNGSVEVALTPPTALIPDFGGADFGPANSIFWGQKGPRLTQGNLTITYGCFQQKQPGSDTWSNVLGAAAMAAGNLANAGPYGWAFGLGSVALQVAAAAVASAQQQGDWHMFDVTQTIDESRLLDLTHGRTWSFTEGGGNAAFQYPWSLKVTVEAWGCADPKPAGPA